MTLLSVSSFILLTNRFQEADQLLYSYLRPSQERVMGSLWEVQVVVALPLCWNSGFEAQYYGNTVSHARNVRL